MTIFQQANTQMPLEVAQWHRNITLSGNLYSEPTLKVSTSQWRSHKIRHNIKIIFWQLNTQNHLQFHFHFHVLSLCYILTDLGLAVVSSVNTSKWNHWTKWQWDAEQVILWEPWQNEYISNLEATKSSMPWIGSAFYHALEWGDLPYQVGCLRALSI